MARKPTDKQLFKMKNEWLGQFYEKVEPKDFYRAVFPINLLLLLILVHIVYVLIRWYVKGCMRSRGYY